METYAVWKSRPVFLTSTFKDMHAERDHLRNHVFPVLEERLKERFHHLEPIDLRWGVETVSVDQEHAKELLVLKVCLAEIERSRPFLIALIGDRYGWIPPEERIRVAAEEAGYEGDVVGKSVTTLEIEYGVLENPGQKDRSWFYFRKPLPFKDMDSETAEKYSDGYSPDPGGKEAHNRLEALKTRIKGKMPERWREYSVNWDKNNKCVKDDETLKEWGKQVLEDLWSDLERETQEYFRKPVDVWQEQERQLLGQFIETQCREFIGRVETIAHLMELATSTATQGATWGASVVGAAGSGKSSLFAEMFRELHELEEKGDILLLAHATGISGRSGRVDSLLRRWIGELAGFLGVPDNSEEMTSREDLENEFASLLSRTSVKKRVVCLIDALNQFERTTAAKYLTWLPKIWPENARLITTAIPGVESEALGKRSGVEEVQLPLLDETEAQHIINAVCARYHKQIHPEIVRILVSKELPDGKPAAGIPLWLELAVEELLLLDADDFERAEREYTGTGEQKLHKLLMDVADKLPPEIEELYAHMLKRTEEIHGEEWARGFANLIALSRNGWRETDIRAMLPGITGKKWDELEFAGLRRSFRAHIVQRGSEGQWDFTHAQMREAISRRSLKDEKEVKSLHTRIADHLESLSTDDPSKQSELMFHIIGSGNRLRAAEYYGGDLTEGELQGATQALAEHVLVQEDEVPNPGLDWGVSLLDLEDITGSKALILCNRYMFELCDTIASDARIPTKHKLLSTVNAKLLRLAASDPNNPGLQRALSVSHSEIGDVLRDQGDLPGALEAYKATYKILGPLAASDPGNVNWQREIAVNQHFVGFVLEAQGDSDGALEAYKANQASMKRLVASDPSNIDWQHDLSISYSDIGALLHVRGDLAGALKAYKASHDIAERLAASDPGNTIWQGGVSISFEKIGDVLHAQGNSAGAIEAYEASHRIRDRLIASDPSNAEWLHGLAISHGKIGGVLLAQGDLTGALEAFEVFHARMKSLSLTDPSNTGWQRDLSVSHEKIGDALRAQDNLAGTLEAFEAALSITDRLAASDPSNALWQGDLGAAHIKIGNVHRDRGDLTAALKAYNTTCEILTALAESDPSNAAWQRDLLASHTSIGDLLRAREDLTGALKAYKAYQAIMKRLTASDPSNVTWQGRLVTGNVKIAEMLHAMNDLTGALKAYKETKEILARLALSDPDNTSWHRNLAACYLKIGDVLHAKGDKPGSLKAYKAALDIVERLTKSDPRNTEWRRFLVASQLKIGDVFRGKRDKAGALKAYRAALDIIEPLAKSDPGNTEWRRNLVVSYYMIAAVHQQEGKRKAEIQYLRRCHKVLRDMRAKGMPLDKVMADLLRQLETGK